MEAIRRQAQPSYMSIPAWGKMVGWSEGETLKPVWKRRMVGRDKQGDGRVLGQGHSLQHNKEQWAGKVLSFSVKY